MSILKKLVLIYSLFLPSMAFSQVVGYEFSPSEITAGKSQVIGLKEIRADGTKTDVSLDFDYEYVDQTDNGKKEIAFMMFNGKPVIYSTISGTGYIIKATRKSNSQIIEQFTVKVDPGVVSKVSYVSGNNQSGFGGETVAPLVVKVQDIYGNGVKGVPVLWTKADLSQTTINSDESGLSTLSYSLRMKTGTDNVKAEVESKTPFTFSLTVKGLTSSLSKVSISDLRSTIFSSEEINFKVSLLDGNNAPVTGINPDITIKAYKNSSCTVPANQNLSGQLTVRAGNGVSYFNGITYPANETIYIRATLSSGEAACSRSVTIQQPLGLASKLIMSTPTKAEAKSFIFPYPRVFVVDELERKTTTAQLPVTLSAYSDDTCQIPATGILAGVKTRNTVKGFTTFAGVHYSSAGTIYLKAESPGLESACSDAIPVKADESTTVSNISIQVPAIGERFSGQAFSLKVKLLNKFNIQIPTAEDVVSLSSYIDSSCTIESPTSLSGEVSLTADFGSAFFTGTVYKNTGSIYVKATAGAVSACSSPITFSAPLLNEFARISFVRFPSFSATINSPLTIQPKFQGIDGSGANIRNPVVIGIDVFSDSTCSTLVGSQVQQSWTSNSGLVEFNNLSFNSLGSYSIRARSNNIVSDCSPLISVGCPAEKHEEGGACVDDTYIPMFSSWNPDQSAVKACDGALDSTRILQTCKRAHDQINVDLAFCGPVILTTAWASPAGEDLGRPVASGNGIKYSTCSVGSKIANSIRITCDATYQEVNGDCVPQTYTALWSEFSSCSAQVCSGSGTQTKTLEQCVNDQTGSFVMNAFCSDKIPPSQSCPSPHGERLASIPNGSGTEECKAGETTWAIKPGSIACNSNYYELNGECIPQTYTARWSEFSSCSAQVCSGKDGGTQTKILEECVSDQTGTIVVNEFCADKTPPSQSCDSSYGTRITSIPNGSGTEECLAGETIWTIQPGSVQCNNSYHELNGECVSQTYTSQWSEFSACSAQVCSGSGTQTKTFVGCISDQTGNSVDNSFCEDKTPRNQMCLSPYGTRVSSITNGSASEECLSGGTTWSMIPGSVQCNSNYFNYENTCKQNPTFTVSCPRGKTETAFSCSPVVTSNTSGMTVSWSATGNTCSSWLSVNSSTGVISGTAPTSAAGVCSLSLNLTAGTKVVSNPVSITIAGYRVVDLEILQLGGGNPYIVFNNKLYFGAKSSGATGYELYVFDGINNPRMIADYNPGSAHLYPSHFAIFNNKLYFNGTTTQYGRELMVMDENENISLAADINPGASGYGSPEYLTVYNGALYFAGTTGTFGRELMRYTASGALELVADIHTTGDSSPMFLTVFNNTLVFSAKTEALGHELRRYNGSTVTLIHDINTGTLDSMPSEFTIYNNNLYFRATTSAAGSELFRYTGSGNPVMVTDIASGTPSSTPNSFIVFNNILYFKAETPSLGHEIWSHNGTTTQLVRDLYVGTPWGVNNLRMATNGSWLYFQGNDGVQGSELWRWSGSGAWNLYIDLDQTNTNPSYLMMLGDVLLYRATYNGTIYKTIINWPLN